MHFHPPTTLQDHNIGYISISLYKLIKGWNIMFIYLSVKEIKNLESKKLAEQISRWETLEKAKAYYSGIDGIYTGYKENKNEINSAYSTPVKIFFIKKLPTF